MFYQLLSIAMESQTHYICAFFQENKLLLTLLRSTSSEAWSNYRVYLNKIVAEPFNLLNKYLNNW